VSGGWWGGRGVGVSYKIPRFAFKIEVCTILSVRHLVCPLRMAVSFFFFFNCGFNSLSLFLQQQWQTTRCVSVSLCTYISHKRKVATEQVWLKVEVSLEAVQTDNAVSWLS
jgi:hypothetical protein